MQSYTLNYPKTNHKQTFITKRPYKLETASLSPSPSLFLALLALKLSFMIGIVDKIMMQLSTKHLRNKILKAMKNVK